MLRSILNPSPSKFGEGVSLLWRGNRLALLNRFIRRALFDAIAAPVDNLGGSYLFESARSAIYNCLVSRGIGDGDEVIISSFTCEAVTYAVVRTGARPVYVDVQDDLTMCDEEVLAAVGAATRAVIMQNTFGRLGLSLETIEWLRQQGLFIIEDCALAIGSEREGGALGAFGHVSVWSLEVSKTVTIGWGGVARSNESASGEALAARYAELGRVSRIADFRRLFQLWFSVLMMRYSVRGAGLVWYFMYGTRIFRRSNSFAKQHPTKSEKMGVLSTRLFGFMEPRLSEIFQAANRNYRVLQAEADRLGLSCPVMEADGELIVAPRFSLIVPKERVKVVCDYGQSIGVEVGRWFSDSPPIWRQESCRVYGCKNAKYISERIVNVSCHWTLSEKEINKVKGFLSEISVIIR